MTTDTDEEAAAASYELLGPEACNAPLPQNPILRELNFGRFITLADAAIPPVGAIAGVAAKVVLPLHVINAQLAPRARETEVTKPPSEKFAIEGNTRGTIPTIEIDNVADLIARKSVSVGNDIGEVSLNGTAVTELLEGGSVVVPVRGVEGHSTLRLNARHADDITRAAVPPTHVVANLSEFLADPGVADSQGKRLALKLQPDHVALLLKNRSIQVTTHTGPITIVPPSDGTEVRAVGNAGETMSMSYAMRADSSNTIRDHPPEGLAALRGADRNSMIIPAEETPPSSNAGLSSPQLGFYVPYVQRWNLLGYSRGALLNSIALAPQEETTIELFSWDRRTNALEQTSTSEAEQNIESVDTTKDTTQVTKELTRDSNFHAEASTHVDVNIKMAEVGGNFGGMAGAGGGTGAKDTAKRTTELIHESTRKASMRVRASRQSKVSESHEFGSEQRSTRRIRNVNMCRALNLDYFEILVNYHVSTSCLRQQAQLVVLVPLPARYNWTRTAVRKFEPTLRAALLDRSFAPGFEASRLLAARDEAFKAVCEKATCPDEGRTTLSSGPELEALQQAAFDVLTAFANVRNWSRDSAITLALMEAAPPDPDNAIGPQPGLAERVHRWGFAHRLRNEFGGVWTALESLVPTGFPSSPQSIKESTFRRIHTMLPTGEGAPQLSSLMTVSDEARQELVTAVSSIAVASHYYDDMDQGRLEGLQTFISITMAFDPISMLITNLVLSAVNSSLDALAIGLASGAVDAKFNLRIMDDFGLVNAFPAFEDAYQAWIDAQASMLKQSEDFATALNTLANERNDQIRNAYPLTAVSEAREREQALLLHLGEYNNYYSFALYQSQLTSGAAKLPAVVAQSQGLISPNAMSMVEGKLAFPVNLDDPTIATSPALTQALRDFLNTQIRNNTELDDGPAPMTVSLPTPGITLETRLGSCNACEDFIAESRAIDLRQRRAAARQAEAEADRLEQRLEPPTPNLDDPSPTRYEPRLTVRLEQPAAAPPP
jgi:hypothetical protein